MSVKSALIARLKKSKTCKIIPIPKSMRPTAESIEKMGERLNAQIRANDAMRYGSEIEAAKRICRNN